MHRFFLIVLSFFITAVSFGSIVPIEKAQSFAQGYFIHRFNVSHEASITEVKFQKVIIHQEKEKPVYYIFNLEKEAGFIIVSAEDATLPVLAYSFEGQFYPGKINEASDVFMKKYADQIRLVREQKLTQSKNIKKAWEEYLTPQIEPAAFAFTTPLLTTNWDQDCYYNLYTPSSISAPCNHVYVGCVATSMAQIMKYYDFPTTGYGTYSYIDPSFGSQSANFGATTYHWSQMPAQLGSSTSLSNKQAVGRLMSHCGISVDMQYGANGSGTSTAFTPDAFSDYFRYNYSATEIAATNYTTNEWGIILK